MPLRRLLWKDFKDARSALIRRNPHLKLFEVYADPAENITQEDIDSTFPKTCDLGIPVPAKTIVDELLAEGCITVLAGRFESYKTMAGIEISSAILDQRPVFDYFEVRQSYDILYLNPDMSPALFYDYARPFGLWNGTFESGRSFRTQGNYEILHAVDSPILRAAVRGKILFLDTMLDYAQIVNPYQSSEWISFFQKLRRLINVYGCVAIVMLTHPTKTAAKAAEVDPVDFLKDSVTFGGKLDVGFAFSGIENTSKVYIQRIKSRPFKQRVPLKFTIQYFGDDGVNYLDQGRFPICDKPGEVDGKQDATPQIAKKKPGRKADGNELAIVRLLDSLEDKTWPEKTAIVNQTFRPEILYELGKLKTMYHRARKRQEMKVSAELEQAITEEPEQYEQPELGDDNGNDSNTEVSR